MIDNNVLRRLDESFDVLEVSLSNTLNTLKRKPDMEKVIQRMLGYFDVLAKARVIRVDLEAALEEGDAFAVAQKVKTINGLTMMIRDDARMILLQGVEVNGH